MRIGYDIDGVLYPWHKILHNYIVRSGINGAKLSYEDFWKIAPDTFGKTFWANVLELDFLMDVEPMAPTIRDMLLRFKGAGIEQLVVTQRNIKIQDITERWLDRSGVGFLIDNLYMVEDKAEICKLEAIDVFVEDRVRNINELKKVCTTFIVSHPFNETYVDPNVIRIPNILWLEDYLNEIIESS